MESTPRIADAFGELLLATLDAGGADDDVPEIVEQPNGYIGAGRMARYFDGFEAWPPRDQWAMQFVRGRVLDIGAGAGRCSLHLQEQGFEVVALDPSPGAAEVCRRRGVRQVFEGTLFDLVPIGPLPFDTFLMMGNNLGFLESREHTPRYLSALAAIASPGARLIGTSLDPYQTDDPSHLAEHERRRGAGKMGGQATLRTRYRHIASPWFDYLMPSIDELRDLTAGTGWSVADIHMQADARYAALLEYQSFHRKRSPLESRP